MGLLNFFDKSYNDTAAGLFIHNGSFRYIEIERIGDCFSVMSALADSVKGGSFMTQADMIFSMLSDFADTKIKISLALSAADSMVKTVSLPMDIYDAKNTMHRDLEQFFPVSREDAMFDLAEIDFPFAEQYDGKHYVVAVMRRSHIRAIRNIAAHYGFEVECIEPAQFALERAASLYCYHRAALLVYLGSSYLQQILFWHGNGIYYRSTDFMNYEYHECYGSGEELKQRQNGNFVNEIESFLTDSYNATKVMPKSIAIFGPSATSDVALALEQKFDTLNVDHIDIMELNNVEMEDSESVSHVYWDVPVGLALRHFDDC